jgi:hypothetical protein
MHPSLRILLFALLVVIAQPDLAAAQVCASGTITAVPSTDPGFQGLYKYCVEVSWDLGRYDLSHLDIFLVLETCECVCDPELIRFGYPAGTASGEWEGSPCSLDYLGQYACTGDPSIPSELNGPAVKFEPDAGAACEPGLTGSGTFCFYSPMPPRAPTGVSTGIAIKHGQQVCYGPLFGEFPSCDCALPTRVSSWGALKASYR